jgi:hypothetical protein
MAIIETRGKGETDSDRISQIVDLTQLYAKRTSLSVGGHQRFVIVTWDDKNMVFTWKNSKNKEVHVSCPIILGRFPNWRPLIPEQNSDKQVAMIGFVAQKWVEAWEGIPINGHELSIGAGTTATVGVQTPQLSGANLPVKSAEGHSTVHLDVTELLIPQLERLGNRNVELRIYGSGDPVRLDQDNLTYILMPMAPRN